MNESTKVNNGEGVELIHVVTDEERLILKAATLGVIDKDDSASYMAELLMDDRWSSYKMYEDIVRLWLGGSEEFRKGIDSALSVLTGWNLDSITKTLLNRAKENGAELDEETKTLIKEPAT
jgi:hypothetical protein